MIVLNSLQLSISRQWFDSYSHSFAGEGMIFVPLLQVKYEHSFRVEKLASRIAGEMEWADRDIRSSQAIGLLHDVGRFPQYTEYGTFYDPSSVDHGDLGHEVLVKDFPWEYFDEPLPSKILSSVKYHNKKIIPEGMDEEILPYLKIVRDADKLDVFEVVREHVSTDRVKDLLPGISLEEKVSEGLVREIEQKGSASYSNVSTLLDFLMVQTTWILDLNYEPSFRILKANGTLDWLREQLSSDTASAPVFEMVQERIHRNTFS